MEIRGNKVIFKAVVGSQSYGTSLPESDVDYKGIFIQSPEDTLENGYCAQIDVTKDEVYYEIGRFVELCCTGNPTMLELLYTPYDCVVLCDPLWQKYIAEVANKFLSKACRHSFGGYAISQIKKAGGLDKKMNWEQSKIIRKTVSDFCYVYDLESSMQYKTSAVTLGLYLKEHDYKEEYCGLVKIGHIRDCYLLFHDFDSWVMTGNRSVTGGKGFEGISKSDANDVCLSDVPAYMTPRGILYFNRDAYSIHCKEYREYQNWLENRNVQRYVDSNAHGQQIDGKNLLHCVRLIETGIEIATLGTINVRRSNTGYLIEIRKGKHDLKTILTKCESDIVKMDEAFMNSELPEKVDEKAMMEIVKNIRKEYYKLSK